MRRGRRGRAIFSVAVAAAQGNYSLGGLRPSSYRLRFVDPTGRHLAEWHADATNVHESSLVGVEDRFVRVDAGLA